MRENWVYHGIPPIHGQFSMRKVVRLIRLHLWEPNMVRLRKVQHDRLILQFLHEITIHWLNFTAIYKDAWNHQKGLTDWKSQCLRWASVENSWSVMLCSPQSNQSPFIASSAGLDHETALFWIIFLMFWLFAFSSIPTTELKSNYVPKVGPGLEGAIDWHQGHCIIMFNSYGKQITWQNAMSCLDV